MNQTERRIYLIERLLEESNEYRGLRIPDDENGQRQLLRGLMNIRMPGEIDDEFLKVQDEYLQEEMKNKGVVTLNDIEFNEEGLGIWQGDITRLSTDAIVNAANSGMTGCYVPNHTCIDNCIHTFAGVELRNKCDELMKSHGEGYEEPTGTAEITSGYNLPCKFVIHTVGPIVRHRLTKQNEDDLASSYRSCLSLADENHCKSIAFCCISTGVFMFPNERAAEIAVENVRKYKKETGSKIKVIFNVFKDIDLLIYENLI